MRRSVLLVVGVVALLVATQVAASAQAPESADVMHQGGVGVLAPDGAQLVRQANGVHVSVQMPTPMPGTYQYADGIMPGHPEVFTLWMFVFNHPEHCAGDLCGPADTTNPAVEFGVYNVAGHAVAGSRLTLSGRVGVGEPAGGPPNVDPFPLSNPAGAEVHLAVTSHGGLDPATLPGEFRRPTGSPMCDCWWVALFG